MVTVCRQVGRIGEPEEYAEFSLVYPNQAYTGLTYVAQRAGDSWICYERCSGAPVMLRSFRGDRAQVEATRFCEERAEVARLLVLRVRAYERIHGEGEE